MNEFTKGEWLTVEPNIGFVYCLDESGDRNQFQFCIQGNGRNGATPKELAANATLCATAGTTATKLAERGYDAIKVLGLLPDIINIIDDLDNLDKTKGGAYIGTLSNGTDVHEVRYYDEFEIEKLKLLAFELLEQCRGE